MPGIVRKLVVFAAIDGLILQPLHQRNQRSLHIEYTTRKITVSSRQPSREDVSVECHGIVGIYPPHYTPQSRSNEHVFPGLLTVAPLSYLIIISGRQQVAQICGIPIYVITDVALVPLASQAEARKSVIQTKESIKGGHAESGNAVSDSDVSDDEISDTTETTPSDDGPASPATASSVDEAPLNARPKAPRRGSSNVVQDVIGRKGQYGRFAERWFSRKGWTAERRRAQGMSVDDQEFPLDPSTRPNKVIQAHHTSKTSAPRAQATDPSDQSAANTYTLLPKLLRTTHLLLSSQSFFFSYDMDVTQRLGTQEGTRADVPLHKIVDQLVSHFLRHSVIYYITQIYT